MRSQSCNYLQSINALSACCLKFMFFFFCEKKEEDELNKATSGNIEKEKYKFIKMSGRFVNDFRKKNQVITAAEAEYNVTFCLFFSLSLAMKMMIIK